jgi:hypothetical protein
MQLDQFYLSLINMTLIDALAIAAGAGMLLSTCIGIMIARRERDAFSWMLGGTAAIIAGTIFGYIVMNAVGSLVAWSGSPIQSLAGADLTEWVNTIATTFAPFQMQAAGFALMGALFGIGLGYGIGSRPDDTSKLGNLIATLGVIAVVMGVMFMLLPSFIAYTYDVAFMYLMLLNGLILGCYGLGVFVNRSRMNSPSEFEPSTVEELID